MTPESSDPLANVLSYLDLQTGTGAPETAVETTVETPPQPAQTPGRSRRPHPLRRWRMSRQAEKTKRAIDRLAVPPWQKRRLGPGRGLRLLLAGVSLPLLFVLLSITPWKPLYDAAGSFGEAAVDGLRGPAPSLPPPWTPTSPQPEVPPPVKTEPTPKPKPAPVSKPVSKPAPKAEPQTTPTPVPTPAPLALVVKGATKPPAGELDLRLRAERLARFVSKHPKPTDAAVRHWLRQHAWVVTGAKWGWAGGEEALVLLIEVDRQVIARWGIGARSEARARYALRQLRYMQAHPEARSTKWLESYALR